jgi:hypothetical protein
MKEKEIDNCPLEELEEFIDAIRSLPPCYVPLAYNFGCPYCKSIFNDTVDTPAKHVREVECFNCQGIFYFNNREEISEGK